jgi:2-C-methyl-D-erythritol 4-phosphate cytidylyltransferase
MKKFVIIVAGGSGSRMGSDVPKQFLELDGKPVLMHTIQVFYEYDPTCQLILVLPTTQQEYWSNLCLKYNFSIPHQIVSGGETRFHSVRNGLNVIDVESIVFIHDGVRPLVSRQTIERCCKTAQQRGNAIPVMPVNESLRFKENDHTVSVDRSFYLSVQTPQTFRSEQIKEAFKQEFDPAFTDDASVAEKAGFMVHVVDGNPENIKITSPTDFIIADAFMKP